MLIGFSEDELKILLNALGLFLQEGASKADEDMAAQICRKIVLHQQARAAGIKAGLVRPG